MQSANLFSAHLGVSSVMCPFRATQASGLAGGHDYCISNDKGQTFRRITGGESWTDGAESDIPNPESRIYIGRISSGRLLLVYNDSSKSRKNMSIALSEDDGKSWKYKTCIDTRDWTSYPDADFRDDRIYIMYDRERVDAKEILFLSVTEQEIINGDVPKPETISKPQN